MLRIRAATTDDSEQRRADLDAARNLARRQGAALFELRSALDYFDARGESPRTVLVEAVDRMPADSGCPELHLARDELASMP